MTNRIMQPTVSTLGIIAIIFVTITATASEAENGGAIEVDINHPETRNTDEKDHRHFPGNERNTRNNNSNNNNNNNNNNRNTKENHLTGKKINANSTISLSYPKKKRKLESTTLSFTMTTIVKRNNNNNNTEEENIIEDENIESRIERDKNKNQTVIRIQDDPTQDPTLSIVLPRSHQRIPNDVTTSKDFSLVGSSMESRLRNDVTVKATFLEVPRQDSTTSSRNSNSSSNRNIGNSNSNDTSNRNRNDIESSSSFSSFSNNLKLNDLHRSSHLRLRLENEIDQEDQKDREHLESFSISSIDSPIPVLHATDQTESIERKVDDVLSDNIKTISFQVSKPELLEEETDLDDKVQERLDIYGKSVRSNIDDSNDGSTGIEDPVKILAETKQDRSRMMNELLIPGTEKSTKAFYEIKPSVKTEIERINDDGNNRLVILLTTTQKTLLGGKFVLPSVDSAIGKFGPYFVDGDQEINVTARIGSTVSLDCKIGLLGDKKVTWVQQHKDSFRLLTVGRIPYSIDERISLHYRYPSNWRLQILYASPRDSGLYKCQVTTHPPLVKKINVIVTAPILTITDDSGRTVAKERHLKAGSALRLRCEARDVLESQNETVIWKRGDETLIDNVSENRTTEMTEGKEVLVIVTTLIVERASPRHAGNYSCVVPGITKTTIAVHVLNGELPAAVHDGNGVSRAVLNLWLIHLTVSYVFFR